MSFSSKNQIAARYANALFAKIDEAKAPKVLRDIAVVSQWCAENKAFIDFIHNPLIAREDAIKVMEKLALAAHFQPLTKDFLRLVTHNYRLTLLPQMVQQVMTLHDQSQGIIQAIITSAQKLGAPQRKSIQELLTEKLKKTLKSVEVIDPQVLGGFKVKVGPYLIDATLRTQLMKIQTLLREA